MKKGKLHLVPWGAASTYCGKYRFGVARFTTSEDEFAGLGLDEVCTRCATRSGLTKRQARALAARRGKGVSKDQ